MTENLQLWIWWAVGSVLVLSISFALILNAVSAYVEAKSYRNSLEEWEKDREDSK